MIKSVSIRIATLSVVALIFATVVPAQSKKGTEDAIRAADQAWEKVFAEKDLGRSVAFVMADGSVLSSNTPIATGHDAISKLFAGFFAIPSLTMDWKVTRAEVSGSGELGYTTGTYKMGFTGPDGKPANDVGKYVTVWKKQKDGSWKVALDIFNSDLPPAGGN